MGSTFWRKLEKADKENKWSLNNASIIQIWRAGCVIQADYISDILEKVYNEGQSATDTSRNKLLDIILL